jgi:hypothetical protein
VEWLETSWATWQSIVGEEETCDRTGGGVWRWTTWLDSSHGVMLNSVSPHSLWHMGIQYLFWGCLLLLQLGHLGYFPKMLTFSNGATQSMTENFQSSSLVIENFQLATKHMFQFHKSF